MSSSDTIAALGVATTLAKSNTNDSQDIKKQSILKLKTAGEIDKNELQKLNSQLEVYLDRARRLEADNKKLLKDVDAAKVSKLPKVDNRKDLDAELNKARVLLENESIQTVKFETDIEKNENAIEDYMNRIRFYENENELQRQKLAKLNAILSEMEYEKDYIIKSTSQAEDDISHEKEKMAYTEGELDNLRKQLANNRFQNKKVEFEIQTLQDEVEFSRAIHDEEVAALKNSLKGVPSKVDLTAFYRNELANAVKNIRADFHKLKEQQLADLKAQKERELEYFKDQAEKQKKEAQALQSKRAQSAEREPFDAHTTDNLNQLVAENVEKANKLADLEEQLANLRRINGEILDEKDNIINDLKQENDNYLNELEYWDRVTRAKLESEIHTYRNLLELSEPRNTLKPIESSITTVTKNESRPTSVPISKPQPQPQTKLPSPVKSVSPPRPMTRPAQPFAEEVRPSSVIISGTTGGIAKPPSPPPQQQPITRPSTVIISSASQNQQSPTQDGGFRPSTVIISGAQQQTQQPQPKLPSPTKTNVAPLQSRPETDRRPHEQLLRKIFDQFDKDRSGRISSYELENILFTIDSNISKNNIDHILKDVDKDRSRDIDFDEFYTLMYPAITGKFTREELINAFNHFDKDHSGQISVEELSYILRNFGTYSDKQIASLVATVDKDKNGQLNFDEFVALISEPIDEKLNKDKKSVTFVQTAEPPKATKQANSKQRDILRNVFDRFDSDCSGYINISEINRILKSLDIELDENEYKNLISGADVDHNGNIDFEEFCKIMEPAMTGNFSIEELKTAFNHFDKDNSGTISVKELSQVLEALGQKVTQAQLAALIETVDKNNDGQLSFQEFVELIRKPM